MRKSFPRTLATIGCSFVWIAVVSRAGGSVRRSASSADGRSPHLHRNVHLVAGAALERKLSPVAHASFIDIDDDDRLAGCGSPARCRRRSGAQWPPSSRRSQGARTRMGTGLVHGVTPFVPAVPTEKWIWHAQREPNRGWSHVGVEPWRARSGLVDGLSIRPQPIATPRGLSGGCCDAEREV